MSKRLTQWLAATAALGLVAAAAQAQQPAKAPSAKAPSAKSPGMVVVRDAETGLLRAPTADEAKALQPSKSSADSQAVVAPATQRALPGGGYGLMVDESTHAYSVVTRQADGTLVESCVTGPDAANKVLNAKRAAPVKFAKGVGHAELK